jgi:hypothetical protein
MDLLGTFYPDGTYTDVYQFSLAFSEFVLLKDITTLCRLKRHLPTKSTKKHGSNAEN